MISTFISKFTHKPIDEVRDILIGCKVIDIEEGGKAIYLENDNKEGFCIDTTGEEIVASAFSTDQERIELMEEILSALLEKLNISEEDLIGMINQRSLQA
jgi:hypothetical protein